MRFLKTLFWLFIVAILGAAGGFAYWAAQPVLAPGQLAMDFAIEPGSSLRSVADQIAARQIPLQPLLFEALVRLTGKEGQIKAGHYAIKPGTTPQRLIGQLVRGEFAQESLVVIEGWTFRQMRQAVADNPALKHDTLALTDKELLAKVTTEFNVPEGLFFPDTYLYAKGASDLQVYRQAHAELLKRLEQAWAQRDLTLPYKTPYEALTMASIIEKETGQKAERGLIAGVFVNRLKKGMLLQTDPTVIYGMGDKFKGNIRKRDLLTDTPFNTYLRVGLPPSPIALPGNDALRAALRPERTDALYFVARGDGTSVFSSNLPDHNRAVNRYQR
ncbi:endolytic transglycosylase MltG [Actimicrobium sp. CCI2.3]|uniref:endolytic transglycosylase MltG n=1 Tax=Actimicrobium sp. CCI2.3 TaxID=3048616 RepID=UPI002AB5D057|nr:endolytic transglycosylase MltG [Actimicrobium sp. CCI2.3]MDY7572898.1 endolytic transglycosylase MltG [Actimicrobium sp. CCI2.3]MEB0020743.1 endolytic transglycosylase MltG [Actimicrobium sp. CCI2.3]